MRSFACRVNGLGTVTPYCNAMHFASGIASMAVLRGLALGAAVASLCGGAIAGGASTPPRAHSSASDSAIPQMLSDDAFEALLAHSPFTRSLGAPDSLILTGVAGFDQDVFATLLDTKTMASHVVSSTPNSAGWQLLTRQLNRLFYAA